MTAGAAAGRTPDGRFGYLAAGADAAPPLVFLHGTGGAARSFAGPVAHFAPRFRAVAWDMPGHGASAPLQVVTIDALAAALAAFLDALGPQHPVLVGHGLGGMVVQRLLELRPHGARAVVLAQTCAAFGPPDGAWQQGFLQARLGPLDAGQSMADLAESMAEGMMGDDPDPAGRALARDCLAHTPDATYRDMVRALPGFDAREALGRIALPALLLAGTRDRSAPAAAMARMAARIPGARFVALEGVGHLAHLERPAAFNAALDRFFAEEIP